MGGPQSDPNPFNYTIEIPPTHQPGTFWYHAHVHGSTAVQVSSGMEGALIIEGGLDDVPTIAAAAEKILVFQQISYDTQGEIEQLESSFGPGTWATLNREHTINGQLFPTISMQPGEVQRWRMIHGGVRETIMVKLVGPSSSDELPDPETLNELPSYALNEVAVDGIALGKLVPWQQVELNPGYRSDVLVTAPLTSGNYFLIDAATTAEQSLNGVAEPTNFLAHIVIGVDPNPMKLPDAEELVKLKPFADIQESEIKATQEVKFCVCQTTDGEVEFTVNGKVFSLDNKWDLQLGQAAEWNVSTEEASLAPSHPFHIHVNPFQVERTLPDGTTEMVWRDTLLVIKGQPQRLLTRYQDYPGKFVLHCHILDHEDQGMMQLLEVVR
jgi:FtsP/CotA-like multicopper oxidase with cupredoxin domain